MNKAEFVRELQRKINKDRLLETNRQDISLGEVDQFVNAFWDTVIENVSQGERITFAGPGRFYPQSRKARIGRNPQTGESIAIPERTIPKFTPGKAFIESVAKEKGGLE